MTATALAIDTDTTAPAPLKTLARFEFVRRFSREADVADRFRVLVPADHGLDDITGPRYIGNFAGQLHVGATVTFVREDYQLLVEAVVDRVDPIAGDVGLWVLRVVERDAPPLGSFESYAIPKSTRVVLIRYEGPVRKWCIYDDASRPARLTSLGSREDAQTAAAGGVVL